MSRSLYFKVPLADLCICEAEAASEAARTMTHLQNGGRGGDAASSSAQDVHHSAAHAQIIDNEPLSHEVLARIGSGMVLSDDARRLNYLRSNDSSRYSI